MKTKYAIVFIFIVALVIIEKESNILSRYWDGSSPNGEMRFFLFMDHNDQALEEDEGCFEREETVHQLNQ